MLRLSILVTLSGIFIISCKKEDTISPIILLNTDPVGVHYRTEPYNDAGAEVADNYTCDLSASLQIINQVDINHYGTYSVIYIVEDEAGNITQEVRNVEITLPLTDYYNQNYSAFDTCTTGNYFYTGLVQDCDCDDFSVTVGNISNLGLSASFNLPVYGQYNQFLTLDTIKAAISFNGIGTMSSGADTINWEYIIQDSISSDVCRSVWIKE